jgi:hypothetical protein
MMRLDFAKRTLVDRSGGNMRKIFLFLGVLTISTTSWVQSDSRPEILVLGTYHMENRGHDIFNLQADNVLLPKRREEIAQLVEVLKRLRPTKIAIEADVLSQRVEQEYSDYVLGKYTLSRDETNQIGYRVAKELGHRAIYPVNVTVNSRCNGCPITQKPPTAQKS